MSEHTCFSTANWIAERVATLNNQQDQNELAAQERTIKRLREDLLRQIADKFGYPLGSKSLVTGMPTVLCLGNHSSGKSTFINHLAGASIQATGVAPTDDGFTLITYGDREVTLDGRATVTDPTLPFQDFEQFGKDFLDHFKLKKRPVEHLREVCLIDSPGLIDNPGGVRDGGRGYDFNHVIRSFANTADLIIFFFDPEKPGTTGESLRLFNDALSDVMYKLLIVFNKVDTFTDVRDFARTYGSLCWNLSRVARTKDIPYIYCTYVPGMASSRQPTIDLADFEKSTEELKREVSRVGQRRRTNMVGALLDSARQIRLHATVTREVGMQLMWTRLAIWCTALLMLAGGGWLVWSYRDNAYALTAGLIAVAGGIGLAAASPALMRSRLKSLTRKLDSFFRELFKQELLENKNNRFLEGVWESVKPMTLQFLKTVGPGGVPFSPLWNTKLRKLKKAIDHDIPQVLGQLSHESAQT